MDKQKALFEDINSSKDIVVIGTSILFSTENIKYCEDYIFNRIKDKKLKCRIIGESENQLFQHSLISDRPNHKRISFSDLKDGIVELKAKLREYDSEEMNSKYLTSSLYLPFFAIKTKKSIWFTPSMSFNIEDYILLDKKTEIYKSILKYTKDLTESELATKYLANPDVEHLELFDQDKVPRGIFPRNTFYNTDHYQYVIWCLVFNREGKLLIHKRDENAKDNQGMWDKSVGGHIDFKEERSSNLAAVRELIEELYKKEKSQQTGYAFSMLSEDLTKVYYLGDWRKENYGSTYLDHIKILESNNKAGEEKWVYYKIPEMFTHNTPREMPDNKGEKWLRVMADVYIFITNTGIDDNHVQEKMENSEFRLVEPNELKSWTEQGEDDKGDKFTVTPDLKFIMTGKLRNVISEVSNSIRFSKIRK